MILVNIIIAALIALATLAARGSARRLVVAGALGLLVVFLTQPWANLIGSKSRYLISPTPIAFSGQMPLLWLPVILAVAVFVLLRRNKALEVGVAGLATGLAALGSALLFLSGPQPVVRVDGVAGVLEVLAPLGVLAAAFGAAQAFKEPNWRYGTLGLGVVAALGFGVFLFSLNGEQWFDSMRGYYKTVAAPSDQDLALVVKDWNDPEELPSINEDRVALNDEWAKADANIVQANSDAEKSRSNFAVERDKAQAITDAAKAALASSDPAKLEAAKAALQEAQLAAKELLSRAYSAITEADRVASSAVYRKQEMAAERGRYGLTNGQALLEPLTTINTAADLPPGYAVGNTASDAGVRRLLPERVAYGFGAWLLFGTLLTFGGAGMLWRREEAQEEADLGSGIVMALIVVILAFGFNAVQFDLSKIVRGWPFITDFWRRSSPPDFQGFTAEILKQLMITVATAMIGTFLAALLALPSSLLAARNLTQRTLVGRIAYVVMRAFYNIDRGVDTLILALILVAAVGLGPLPGVVAMAIHSMADLGKLYSEAMENTDKGPLEALEASGAPGTSVIRWALFPQVLPLLVGFTLYRFEINFRVSIILGFVGAGGIGFLIQETMRSGKYDQMAVAIIAVILMVNVLDFISASVRRRIIG
jgi:phosphonate ABC transporter permease subunit PhnE